MPGPPRLRRRWRRRLPPGRKSGRRRACWPARPAISVGAFRDGPRQRFGPSPCIRSCAPEGRACFRCTHALQLLLEGAIPSIPLPFPTLRSQRQGAPSLPAGARDALRGHRRQAQGIGSVLGWRDSGRADHAAAEPGSRAPFPAWRPGIEACRPASGPGQQPASPPELDALSKAHACAQPERTPPPAFRPPRRAGLWQILSIPACAEVFIRRPLR